MTLETRWQTLSLMADQAYDGNDGTSFDGFTPIYEVTSLTEPNGFSAVSYFNATTSELVIAFGGSETPGDFAADVLLALFNNTTQQFQTQAFVDFTVQLVQTVPSYAIQSITYTGHSLGGYLAQYAEVVLQDRGLNVTTEAVVFNSTGYPPNPLNQLPDVDVTYVYSDARYWHWSAGAIHNLDDRITPDVYYVLDEPGQEARYASVPRGHGLAGIREALSAGRTGVTETALIQMIANAISEAGSISDPHARAIAHMEVRNTFGQLPTEVYREAVRQSNVDQCFPAGTPIHLWDGTTKPIEEITRSDIVLTHDQRGTPVPGHVDKLFTNTTQEFVRLTFADGRDDLIATPGHRFLTETGDYIEVGQMLRLGGGTARLTDTDGSFAETRDILAGDGQIVLENAVGRLISG